MHVARVLPFASEASQTVAVRRRKPKRAEESPGSAEQDAG